MEPKISKSLEDIIARATFASAKAGAAHSYGDFLMLELLRDESTLAYQIVSSRIKYWEMDMISTRLERETAERLKHPAPDTVTSPELFFEDFLLGLKSHTTSSRSVSTAHALHRLLLNEQSAAPGIFSSYGITPSIIEEEMHRFMFGSESPPDHRDDTTPKFRPLRPIPAEEQTEETTEEQIPDRYGRDLREEASLGKIDPVIGREEEIERIIQILARRKKNNPILIGEAGVGKSAVVEGLALRMVEGSVPPSLADKRIVAIDPNALVAGTKFRGDFEERMQQLIAHAEQQQDTILFFDEIHTLVGSGSAPGSLDMANILKPALARGRMQVIGATTYAEYHSSIEQDAALERRFQRVAIHAPTPEQTLRILSSLAPHYAAHHRVHYTEEALRACITLAERYITDRRFPDKAIDLMDEAGALTLFRSYSRPGRHETASPVPNAAPETKISTESAVTPLLGQGEATPRFRPLPPAREEMHTAPLYGSDSAEDHPEDRPTEAFREHHTTTRPAPSILGEDNSSTPRRDHTPAVDEEAVRRVVTIWTGIPTERLTTDDLNRLGGLASRLRSRIIGQDKAVEAVSRTILRARTGLRDENRPMGVFLFAGSTGVGKTLLAKELGREIFGGGESLIRLDMSEYSERHNISRMIGSPPGYVGYGEGGQLTEAVRRNPYSVVLFDEIEKAHPEVFNLLLQVFDEGHLTDGEGRRIDFRHTILIMTSNLGASPTRPRPAPVGFIRTMPAPRTSPGERSVEGFFPPEFLNRIDEQILFRPLEPEHLARIVDLELKRLVLRTEGLGYRLRISPAARRILAREGYSPRYGARPLRRLIVDRIEAPLAEMIVGGKIPRGADILAESDRRQGLRFRIR